MFLLTLLSPNLHFLPIFLSVHFPQRSEWSFCTNHHALCHLQSHNLKQWAWGWVIHPTLNNTTRRFGLMLSSPIRAKGLPWSVSAVKRCWQWPTALSFCCVTFSDKPLLVLLHLIPTHHQVGVITISTWPVGNSGLEEGIDLLTLTVSVIEMKAPCLFPQ